MIYFTHVIDIHRITTSGKNLQKGKKLKVFNSFIKKYTSKFID